MVIIAIQREAVERIGRNWVGNIYKYRWCVYIKDDRKEHYGLTIGNVKVKKIFTGTKPEVKKWLKDNNQQYDWNN